MNIVHLTASTFFGGPERQMLGLAQALPKSVHTTFVSFAEGGQSAAFLDVVREAGFAARQLTADTPRLLSAIRELTETITALECQILLCHGYKANILGRIAANRAGIKAIAVSRGWTGENRKVRAYEWLDRRNLKYMAHVVAVSEGQAAKVRRCGVDSERLTVIRNSARLAAFADPDPDARQKLLSLFDTTPNTIRQVVVAAGRLSPEKGFSILIEAAATICSRNPATGVVIFGNGKLRDAFSQRIADLGLRGKVILAGYRSDLDILIPGADVVVLPSFTEGLPNVALEASAAGVAVVATAVGGTPEVIVDGETGYLVSPGDQNALAARILELLHNPQLRSQMGINGRDRMYHHFTFESQARDYLRLFETLGILEDFPPIAKMTGCQLRSPRRPVLAR